MNIAISEACKQVSDAEKGKIEIRLAIPFVPESTVESDRTDKNKDEFISVTCRYRPSSTTSITTPRGITEDSFKCRINSRTKHSRILLPGIK